MNITFDLKDAKVFIPSGRMGNLTKTIWSNISLSQEEIKNAFEKKDYDFSDISISNNDLIDNYSQKSISEFRSLTKSKTREAFNSFSYNEYLQKHSVNIAINYLHLITESSDFVTQNQEFKDKLAKLKKLQQFNEINKEI